MILVQISDPHVSVPGSIPDRRYCSADRLQTALNRINGFKPTPDAVIITGDLVDAVTPDEYDRLAGILASLRYPCYLLLGNHDSADMLRRALPGHAYLPDGPDIQYVIDDLPVRLIMLDTNIPKRPEGELTAARLDWLADQLAAAPGRPTMIFMHHPPMITGLQAMDRMGLVRGRNDLAELLQDHKQVLRICCGHLHRPILGLCGGVPVQTCPSVAHQIDLDLNRDDWVGLVQEPPSMLVHTYSPDAGLVTHTALIDRFPDYPDNRS